MRDLISPAEMHQGSDDDQDKSILWPLDNTTLARALDFAARWSTSLRCLLHLLVSAIGMTLKFSPVQQLRQLSWGRPAVAAANPAMLETPVRSL